MKRDKGKQWITGIRKINAGIKVKRPIIGNIVAIHLNRITGKCIVFIKVAFHSRLTRSVGFPFIFCYYTLFILDDTRYSYFSLKQFTCFLRRLKLLKSS